MLQAQQRQVEQVFQKAVFQILQPPQPILNRHIIVIIGSVVKQKDPQAS